VPCNNHKKQTITTFSSNKDMLASLSFVTAPTQLQESMNNPYEQSVTRNGTKG
jgi:hypothetical protein